MKTASQIAWECYKENEPINWAFIESIRKNYNRKERVDWARNNVEIYADGDTSKNKLTRAAKELLNLLGI